MHRDWVTEIGGATFAGAARSIRSYPLEDLEAAELNEHCFAVMHWPTNRRRLPPFAASQSATNAIDAANIFAWAKARSFDAARLARDMEAHKDRSTVGADDDKAAALFDLPKVQRRGAPVGDAPSFEKPTSVDAPEELGVVVLRGGAVAPAAGFEWLSPGATDLRVARIDTKPATRAAARADLARAGRDRRIVVLWLHKTGSGEERPTTVLRVWHRTAANHWVCVRFDGAPAETWCGLRKIEAWWACPFKYPPPDTGAAMRPRPARDVSPPAASGANGLSSNDGESSDALHRVTLWVDRFRTAREAGALPLGTAGASIDRLCAAAPRTNA
ncbi:hypothetical protein M885DRAFT_559339 [Pelagophyceae sp. CCMP2097]|nr:hypothetical protein M885DRAFT_559339 [Pelagophyceae sp. CCMP2097]